ncbi:MAG: hypothetical protein ACFFCS_06805 [Candidatus Hodarchaeota archaeon]
MLKRDVKENKETTSFSKAIKGGMVVLVIFGGFLAGVGFYFQFGQEKYATILYHYNAEYRAGKTSVENNIINKAIPELIMIYSRHPDWNWTLELQAWAIVNLSIENTTVFGILRDMINRGQCELITPLWSYQLLTAFSLDDVNASLTMTRNQLQALGITKFTRVLFFQESQSFPGFGNQVFKDLGFDTVMVGTHLFALHGIPIDAPLYKARLWNDPSTEFYYLPYNWVPEAVTGGFHFWTFLATGETVLGTDAKGGDEYFPPPELVQAHEEHLAKLHGSGYKLMTINDYVDMLENRGNYKQLDTYIPEATWRDVPGTEPSRDNSNGLWTWMGYNTNRGNATHPGNDDGAQLAETYRTGNYLKAVKTILRANWTDLNVTTRNNLNGNLTEAYKHYFKAQGTDGYGWEPGWIIDNVLHETDYSRNNNKEAMRIAAEVVSNLSQILGLGNQIQVYTANLSVNGSIAYSNDTASWINETVTPTNLTLDDLPRTIEISLDAPYTTYTINISNCSYQGFNYQKLNVSIPELSRLRMKLGETYPLWYCPTFHETRAYEYTLEGDEPYFLPLSNGLLFFGSESNGVAIIKNCSTRHVSLETNQDWIGYWEQCKDYTVKDVEYGFIVFQGNLQDSIDLANLVNTRPIINLELS